VESQFLKLLLAISAIVGKPQPTVTGNFVSGGGLNFAMLLQTLIRFPEKVRLSTCAASRGLR
jgi:hypothetical protein